MVARNKVVLNGSLGTVEAWSAGFHFVGAAGATVTEQAELDTWAADAATALDTLVTGVLGNFLSTTGTIDEVLVQAYGSSGGVVRQGLAPVPSVTGGAAIRCTYPTACVFSMRTGLPGASFRGRSYWPALGAVITNENRFSSADTEGGPVDFAELLEGLAAAAPGALDMQPVVYSPTLDLVTAVTLIQMGNVPDTQRRRRDALVEAYETSPYPPV